MGRRSVERHRRSPCRAQEVSAEFLAPPHHSHMAVGNSPIPTPLLYLQAPHSWLRSAMKSPILLLSQHETIWKHLSRHTHRGKAPFLKIVHVCRTRGLAAAFSLPAEMGIQLGRSLPSPGQPCRSAASPRHSWARAEPAHGRQHGSEDAVSQDREIPPVFQCLTSDTG